MSLVSRFPELTYYRGRVALAEILKAIGVGKNDLVATQAFTCLAMPEGIMATGAKPLWIDIEQGGVNMDPESLRKHMSEDVKAVIVQHTFGIPAQLDLLVEVCKEWQVPLIEDCCHTYASKFAGRTVGEFGVGSFYSFEWGKPMVAGIGGSAILNDNDLNQKVKDSYASFEMPSKKSELKIGLQYAGYSLLYAPKRFWMIRDLFQKLSSKGVVEGNYNPSNEVAADFSLKMTQSSRNRLLVQVNRADMITQRSNGIVDGYLRGIDSAQLRPVFVPELAEPVYARLPFLATNKKIILEYAREANVEIAEWYSTAVHPLGPKDWEPIGLEEGMCPEAELRASEIISLPINGKANRFVIHQTVEFLNSLV